MNLIGHRGQDQSAGLIRSDYINHILHGTDVLRKIAKMPKWQSLCFIIYVMDINLVNHENLLNLVVDWFLRFSSVTMPMRQPTWLWKATLSNVDIHTVWIIMINHGLKILPKRDRGKLFSELVEPINKWVNSHFVIMSKRQPLSY